MQQDTLICATNHSFFGANQHKFTRYGENMHDYYFKIKKGDLEFEFSTTDKFTFEEKLSDWINGVVKGQYVAPPVSDAIEGKAEPADMQRLYNAEAQSTFQKSENEENTEQTAQIHQRSGFIDVKNLASINQMTTPKFDAAQNSPIVEEVNFERALEESIQNPKTEVVEKVDSVSDFEGYFNSYNPQTPIDKLIVTALYVMNMEHLERFTIKQLNAKLVPLTGKPVDHSLIEDAINQNLVRIVPDLTGASDFTEYTLTEEGEGYFVE